MINKLYKHKYHLGELVWIMKDDSAIEVRIRKVEVCFGLNEDHFIAYEGVGGDWIREDTGIEDGFLLSRRAEEKKNV